MTPQGTVQRFRTTLLLGIQLDEEDFLLFLNDYYRDLRGRFAGNDFPDFSPPLVLDELIQTFEDGCDDGRAGRRTQALSAYSLRAHNLHLAITGSDYGSLEQRTYPYSFDRVFYHLGHQLIVAEFDLDYPGYNPYRSTRRLDPQFVAANLHEVLELLPDFLWWAAHDKLERLRSMLRIEELEDLQRTIELAGLKTENFGLYLVTQELLLLPGEIDPPFHE